MRDCVRYGAAIHITSHSNQIFISFQLFKNENFKLKSIWKLNRSRTVQYFHIWMISELSFIPNVNKTSMHHVSKITLLCFTN